jgi:hypothetical protein
MNGSAELTGKSRPGRLAELSCFGSRLNFAAGCGFDSDFSKEIRFPLSHFHEKSEFQFAGSSLAILSESLLSCDTQIKSEDNLRSNIETLMEGNHWHFPPLSFIRFEYLPSPKIICFVKLLFDFVHFLDFLDSSLQSRCHLRLIHRLSLDLANDRVSILAISCRLLH